VSSIGASRGVSWLVAEATPSLEPIQLQSNMSAYSQKAHADTTETGVVDGPASQSGVRVLCDVYELSGLLKGCPTG